MKNNKLVIYQSEEGVIELPIDTSEETIWATQSQIAEVFDVTPQNITMHLKSIYADGELKEASTCKDSLQVQKEGSRKVSRKIKQYNLDAVLSVGYRVNSKKATQFRIWATRVLKQHLLQGYTVNEKRISVHYAQFLQAINDIKDVHPGEEKMGTKDVLELVNAFADTWVSLEAYDSEKLPRTGATKKEVTFTAEELESALLELKNQLAKKKQASGLFGLEREKKAVQGIVGSIFQSFGGKDLYPSVEEKAAHLLYFIVKNHPFVDGNKRSGAFAFIWYLRSSGILKIKLTPEALTSLTLLVAESDPKHKDRIIRLTIAIIGETLTPTS